MLNRTVANPIGWLARWPKWQRDRHAEAVLAHYLLLVLAICTLGCLYYWQASEVRALQSEVEKLEFTAYRLERENMRLVEQSARWNSPAYIEARMQEEGYIPAEVTVRVRLSPANGAEADSWTGRRIASRPRATAAEELNESP